MNVTDEQRDQRGANHSWKVSAGGVETLALWSQPFGSCLKT